MIPAIETRYDGCLFRSRTEARWAVFFNTVGLRWEYEKEGYNLPSGPYLPDFFLPNLNVWFEVKGKEPTHAEVESCIHLQIATLQDVWLAIGSPGPLDQIITFPYIDWGFDDGDKIWCLAHDITLGTNNFCWRKGFFVDDRKIDGDFWIASDDFGAFHVGPGEGSDKYPGLIDGRTDQGYEAARTHRFW